MLGLQGAFQVKPYEAVESVLELVRQYQVQKYDEVEEMQNLKITIMGPLHNESDTNPTIQVGGDGFVRVQDTSQSFQTLGVTM